MPSSGSQTAETMLSEATKRARNYEWGMAADFCQRALEDLSPDETSTQRTMVLELLAKCHFKGAFQSPNKTEFERRIRLAQGYHLQASTLFEKTSRFGPSKRSRAGNLFAGFWLEPDVEKRRGIIDSCIAASKEARNDLEGTGDKQLLAETDSDLLAYFREALNLATEMNVLTTQFDEALRIGRRAINEFLELGDDIGLLESLSNTIGLLAVDAQSVLEPSAFESIGEETRKLGELILQVSQRIGSPYAVCLASEEAGNIAFNLDGDYPKATSYYGQGASAAQSINDSLLSGRMFWLLAQVAYWEGLTREDAEERRKVLTRGLEFGAKAIQILEIPAHTTDLTAAYAAYANCYIDLAITGEIEPETKKRHLRAAIENATKGTNFERATWAWCQAGHALSKALYFLALMENDRGQKAQRLREALPVREETLRVTGLLFPHFWSHVVNRNYLALIKAEMATVETTPEAKTDLLRSADADMRKCMDLGAKWATNQGFIQRLSQYSEWYGDILFQIYCLNGEPNQAELAIKAYSDSISLLTKSEQIGSYGPLSWKTARVYDSIGDFKGASKAFSRAAEGYRLAAQKLPGLASTYSELASYMDAWVRIQNSRLYHAEEEYEKASANYNEAAKSLLSTKTWRYLSRLCTARSLLEKGEALSKNEKHSTATESFRKAVETFREAREELKNLLEGRAGAQDEQDLKYWLETASQRENYSIGRMELEEARILDRKGEKTASSKKYRSASNIFRELQASIKGTQESPELETLAGFCDAWASMKDAEAKEAPDLYTRAAESFNQAAGTTTKETFRLLALANASICRALSHGTRFRITRDADFYAETKKQLESAADLYQEAGFKKIGSWTRATQRLFDALAYLSDAESEKDPRKKTENYDLAERQLEVAARLYGEAGFPTKRQEALDHLGRAQEAKALLLSSIRALAEIPALSGASLSSISPGRGQSLGLEKFEGTNVVGDLKPSQKEVMLGSELTLSLELTNVGKTTATLLKLEGIVPEGFEMTKNSQLALEGDSIDLKGKRLDYLKAHGLTVTLKPVRRGAFELRPRLTYVDDRGNLRSYQLGPELVLVHAPGLSGLGPAPSHLQLPEQFQFEDNRSREIFHYLVKTFLEDHMSKRLHVEGAGWRSLMDIIRELKLPRSTLYGPGGRKGSVLAELERRGLVETRIFPKERGRGGEIIRIRVAYESTIVRRILEQIVMENP